MKVILSRKGMDSTSGGMTSPILPDGTLLSLPIPDGISGKPYEDISYKEKSYKAIISQLAPRFDFSKNPNCHFDPDIYEGIGGRPNEWKAAFGQYGVSATHLDKMNVGVGDIFLFYGMFRQTAFQDGMLKFVHNAPVWHIIYGYMKVGEILRETDEISRYNWHPHSKNNTHSNNRLYLPCEYGTFKYDDLLVLTKQCQGNRRLWALPPFFGEDGISISWQGNNRPLLKDGYAELNSAPRGQEFVITAATADLEKTLCDWVDCLIEKGTK